MWEFIAQKPSWQHDFDNLMLACKERKDPWLDIYPAHDELFRHEFEGNNDVILVDVGGGVG